MKREYRCFIAFVVAAMTFLPLNAYANGSKESTGTSPAAAVKLSFWSRDSDAAFVQPLVKQYDAEKGVDVSATIIPASQFVAKFATSMAAGAGPDIIASDLVYGPRFASEGLLTDITKEAKALPFFSQLSPSHVRLSTYKGQLYALPFSAEASVLLYNKGLFKQAGLDPNSPPTTWAAVVADAKKITALGNGVKGFYFSGSCAGCMAFTFLPLIWGSGGDVLSADGHTATLTGSTQLKAALELYHSLWADGSVSADAKTDNGANFINMFMTGKIGMQGAGAFTINVLKSQKPDIDFGVSYLPGQNGGTSSFAGGDIIGIPKGSKNVKAAFDFIAYTLSRKVQEDFYLPHGSLPVRNDIAKSVYDQVDSRYNIGAKAMAEGKTPYSVDYNALFNDLNGPWIQMIQDAVFNGNVDQSIQTAQNQFTQILSGKAGN